MNSRMNKSTLTIAKIGLFTAVTAILSQIAIPLPSGVPITLQTFTIALCGYVLGSKNGPLSILIYILLGALGVPVFANFKAGIGVLFGVTGGFIWGFIILAYLCGLNIYFKNEKIGIILGLVGLTICHILGVAQFALVTSSEFLKSFLIVSMPYLIKDSLSIVAAYLVAVTVRKRLVKANLIEID
ncbi:MAG: biotin transporter BioY [Tissierellia bacterium]|nr:biotin transporter BioY [Tissierellia bacterium]MDD4779251.1 biotin transporter BioY [Tissierellia bacterium]